MKERTQSVNTPNGKEDNAATIFVGPCLWYHLNPLDLEVIFTIVIREIKVIPIGSSILRFNFVAVSDRHPLIVKRRPQGVVVLPITRVLTTKSKGGKHIDDPARGACTSNVFLDRK